VWLVLLIPLDSLVFLHRKSVSGKIGKHFDCLRFHLSQCFPLSDIWTADFSAVTTWRKSSMKVLFCYKFHKKHFVINIYILRVSNNLLFSLLNLIFFSRSIANFVGIPYISERKKGMFSDIDGLMTPVTLTLIVASFPFWYHGSRQNVKESGKSMIVLELMARSIGRTWKTFHAYPITGPINKVCHDQV